MKKNMERNEPKKLNVACRRLEPHQASKNFGHQKVVLADATNCYRANVRGKFLWILTTLIG